MPGKDIFVICPIGKKESPERRNSDRLMKFLIEPVAASLDMTVDRADLMLRVQGMHNQIMQQLTVAPLVIADMTGHNPNVFYELAVRNAARKPCVPVMTGADTIPFDVTDFRATYYSLEVDEIEESRELLRRTIEEIDFNEPVESPVSAALISAGLAASADPRDQRDAALIRSVSEMQAQLSHLVAARANDGGRLAFGNIISGINQIFNVYMPILNINHDGQIGELLQVAGTLRRLVQEFPSLNAMSEQEYREFSVQLGEVMDSMSHYLGSRVLELPQK